MLGLRVCSLASSWDAEAAGPQPYFGHQGSAISLVPFLKTTWHLLNPLLNIFDELQNFT